MHDVVGGIDAFSPLFLAIDSLNMPIILVSHALVLYKAITTNKSEADEMLLAGRPCSWVVEPSPRICSELKRGCAGIIGESGQTIGPPIWADNTAALWAVRHMLVITRHRMRKVKMEVSIGLATEFTKGGRSGCVSWINCSRRSFRATFFPRTVFQLHTDVVRGMRSTCKGIPYETYNF
jgi:hypothetical protein